MPSEERRQVERRGDYCPAHTYNDAKLSHVVEVVEDEIRPTQNKHSGMFAVLLLVIVAGFGGLYYIVGEQTSIHRAQMADVSKASKMTAEAVKEVKEKVLVYMATHQLEAKHSLERIDSLEKRVDKLEEYNH